VIDSVHDTQRIFRALVKASSYPGTIQELGDIAKKMNLEIPLSRGALLLSLTLLDREVNFHTPQKELAQSLSRLTYSPSVEARNAEFIVIPQGCRSAELISSACRGTLINPHKGATIILEVDSLEERGHWILRGPGIKTENRVNIKGSDEWLKPRNESTREFPLGVDLYLVDHRAALMVLPRTTVIRREEEWPM